MSLLEAVRLVDALGLLGRLPLLGWYVWARKWKGRNFRLENDGKYWMYTANTCRVWWWETRKEDCRPLLHPCCLNMADSFCLEVVSHYFLLSGWDTVQIPATFALKTVIPSIALCFIYGSLHDVMRWLWISSKAIKCWHRAYFSFTWMRRTMSHLNCHVLPNVSATCS